MNLRIFLTKPFVYVLFTTCVLLMPATLSAQNANAKAGATDIPRMPDGKPDLSGVWERPFVPDMTKNGRDQQGEAELPFTEEFDYSAHCLPLGYTRGINSPMPVEIVQRPNRIVSLYETNNTFHVVFTDGRDHPKDLEPTWFGHSIGKLEGDTLMVDTVGFNNKTWPSGS